MHNAQYTQCILCVLRELHVLPICLLHTMLLALCNLLESNRVLCLPHPSAHAPLAAIRPGAFNPSHLWPLCWVATVPSPPVPTAVCQHLVSWPCYVFPSPPSVGWPKHLELHVAYCLPQAWLLVASRRLCALQLSKVWHVAYYRHSQLTSGCDHQNFPTTPVLKKSSIRPW